MAAPRSRRGFTLVELLVVITIIGMLMALLLPAIQTAREAGRRNTCANNVRQVAIALSSFHDNKRSFPGYANVISGKRASWVVSILPYMERNDLYQIWQTSLPQTLNASAVPNGTTLSGGATPEPPNPWAYTEMNILLCPSNPAPTNGSNALSYIVNCGSASTANDSSPHTGTVTTWPEDGNSGVFFNHVKNDKPGDTATVSYGPTAFTSPGSVTKSTMDFISTNDGTSYTLLCTENLQAGNWATDPLDSNNYPYKSEFQIKRNTGFVWFITGNANNVAPPAASFSTNYNANAIEINDLSKDISSNPDIFASTTGGGLAYARPSAAHPGGVNAIFCDGHLRFLTDETNYKVYTQLMTPRGKVVKVDTSGVAANAAAGSSAVTTPWTYILNEADY